MTQTPRSKREEQADSSTPVRAVEESLYLRAVSALAFMVGLAEGHDITVPDDIMRTLHDLRGDPDNREAPKPEGDVNPIVVPD